MRGADEESVKALVADLFRFLDARDYPSFLGLFEPGAAIVHDDGESTTPERFAGSLQAAQAAPARSRRLGRFSVGVGSELAWAGYENRAVFGGPGGEPRELSFSETAIFARRPEGWRIVRLHYSGDRGRAP